MASNAIRADILLEPTLRSLKTIGISVDPEPRQHCPVGDLDLENVPLGPDRLELDRLEDPPMDAFEAAGEVVDRDAEDRPGVQAATAADEARAAAPNPRRRRPAT